VARSRISLKQRRRRRAALRVGIAGGAFGALAAGSAAGVYRQLFRRPLPKTRGTVTLDGISSPVEIRRDRWGVPHIRASTAHDLWFGEGFCHGQDRLWQLDLYRRTASGRLSEIAGKAGLRPDRFMRTLGLHRTARREEAALDPDVRSQLEALCAGVNAAAASRPLPAELQLLRVDFEPFEPAHALALTKLLSFGLSTNWERELLRAEMTRELGEELATRLDPGYPKGNPVILTPGEAWSGDGLGLAEQIAKVRDAIGLAVEATGSNNWAVSGERSATGGPLLAGDPHLPPSMPGITYQVGLYLGERFCRGASLPGLPGLMMGQTNDVTWSFTNVLADVMDLFIERVDGDAYEFEGEMRPLEVIEEEIAVKGRTNPERLVVRETHHGPIVNEALGADDAEPLALRFSALDFPGITRASLAVLDWSSGPELVASLADHAHPVSNLVWADRHGSIGYKTVGRLPVRRGDCPDHAKPGLTGEHELDGWVAYGELPELVDPEPGFIVTANNRIAPEDYPHHITTDYLDGYRAKRIEQLIVAEPEHDLDSFESMQTDMLSLPGLETAHRLTRLRPRDQRELAAIERLRSWDGRMGTESIAATIYQAFTLRLAREVTRAAIGDRDLADRWLDRADNGFIAHVPPPGAGTPTSSPSGRKPTRRSSGGPGTSSCWTRYGPGWTTSGAGSGPIRRRGDGAGCTRWSFPTPLGPRTPSLPGSSTAISRSGAARRPSPRWVGIPTTRSRPSGRRAGAWSPTRRIPSARAGRLSPANRGIRGVPITTICRATGRKGGRSRWRARGPGGC